MNIIKAVLSIFASVFLLIVLTILFVYARISIESPNVKAVGLSVVKEWTIYSPLYWLLVLVLVIFLGWLFRSWVLPHPVVK